MLEGVAEEAGGCVLVLVSSLAAHDNVGRLSSIECSRHFAVLLLTLVTTSRCFALARRGTAATSYPLVVCAGVIRERVQD